MRVSADKTTIILADPPWPHANGSRTNSGKSPKYPLMNLREIGSLGGVVSRLAGDDAVLYLWATTPHLPGAIDTISAWGFTYRSLHVWRKAKIACGFWARSNAEIVLIGERGRPCPPNRLMLMSTILEGAAERRAHSSKPVVLHELIERQWGASRKIELFARRNRPEWECYGSDLGHIISERGVTDEVRAEYAEAE